MNSRPRIVVAGAGFGGLHAAFSLRQALPGAALTVVSRSAEFFYRPDSIYVPFGLDPDSLSTALVDPLRHRNIEFVLASVTGIDVGGQLLFTDDRTLGYDYLVMATGAQTGPHAIPGLTEHGLDITSIWQLLALRRAFTRLVADAAAGARRQVLFVVPPGTHFSGPLYEIALMLETWLSRQDYRSAVDITVVTFEERLLQALGPAVHDELITAFVGRHVDVHTGWHPLRVTAERVVFDEGVLAYDVLVTCPAPVGAVALPGLPYDPRRFLRTDVRTRRVDGTTCVYAVGDAAGDQLLKQAYLAFSQATVAAHQIVAAVKEEAATVFYDPRSRYILDTMDAGMLVDTPLGEASSEQPPAAVTSRLWHVSKQLLGRYLAWKVRSGQPFADLLDRGAARALRARAEQQ